MIEGVDGFSDGLFYVSKIDKHIEFVQLVAGPGYFDNAYP